MRTLDLEKADAGRLSVSRSDGEPRAPVTDTAHPAVPRVAADAKVLDGRSSFSASADLSFLPDRVPQ